MNNRSVVVSGKRAPTLRRGDAGKRREGHDWSGLANYGGLRCCKRHGDGRRRRWYYPRSRNARRRPDDDFATRRSRQSWSGACSQSPPGGGCPSGTWRAPRAYPPFPPCTRRAALPLKLRERRRHDGCSGCRSNRAAVSRNRYILHVRARSPRLICRCKHERGCLNLRLRPIGSTARHSSCGWR